MLPHILMMPHFIPVFYAYKYHSVGEYKTNLVSVSNICSVLSSFYTTLKKEIPIVRELTKELYTRFIEDDKLTQVLTDIVELSDAFSGLNAAEFEVAVRENISKLNRLYSEKERKEIRDKYKQVNNDEIEALKMQMQLRDKIRLRTGDK